MGAGGGGGGGGGVREVDCKNIAAQIHKCKMID